MHLNRLLFPPTTTTTHTLAMGLPGTDLKVIKGGLVFTRTARGAVHWVHTCRGYRTNKTGGAEKKCPMLHTAVKFLAAVGSGDVYKSYKHHLQM